MGVIAENVIKNNDESYHHTVKEIGIKILIVCLSFVNWSLND